MADTTFVNGTVITADWLNDVNDFAYGTNSTIDSPGTKSFPDGLIIKWGTGTCTAGSGNVIYATAFPNAVYDILITDNNASSWSTSSFAVYGTHTSTVTGFSVKNLNWNGSAFTAGSGSFNWVVIGK